MADNKKVALVTGANKGIGFETARELQSWAMSLSSARVTPAGGVPRSTS